MSYVKSPLRYPGGKSKAIKQIIPHLPINICEYREPFLGGGSVCFRIKQLWGDDIKKYWINDLNYDLYCFWICAKNDLDQLIAKITEVKNRYEDGQQLFQDYTSKNLIFNEFDRAVRFFILNRITFSGTVDSGGYSQQAFERRFTDSSIARLSNVSTILSSTTITNQDYTSLLFTEGKNVFIFLDPPYLRATKSRLYGLNGNLHTSFEHKKFAQNMQKCHHRWLITYDDSPEIRELFNFANITEFTLQYGMNNYKQKTAAKGKEILIKNY